MFSGDVNMWRSIVTGKMARNTTNAVTCPSHDHWWTTRSVDADQPSTSVLSG